ncbi:MAG: helix-hairpin-helix domain-containing protein [Pseudomonadota bacterium]
MQYDPFKAFGDVAATLLESSLDAQKRWFDAMDQMARPGKATVAWVSVELPVFSPAAMMDEAAMRDAFQAMADRNLRQWEHTANLLSATPEWMRTNYKTPGAMMTDWFDRLQRATPMGTPANDAGAAPKSEPPKRDGKSAAEATPKTPTLYAKPDGTADDLTKIKGIGPKVAKALNELGIFHFSQIAEWSKKDATWVAGRLSGRGRAAPEEWIKPARKLAKSAA